MKIKIRSLIWKGISLVLIVGLIVAICIGTSTAYFWQMQLDRILCPPITDSEAVALGAKEGQQMAAQVITEGAVLLENKDNVLPLSKDDDRRVNVFGYNSVDWMHGAGSSGSSGRVMKENANSEIIDFLRAMTRYGISYNSELQEIDLANPDCDGQPIMSLGLPEGALVVYVKRGKQYITPRGNTEVKAGDKLLVMSNDAETMKAAKNLLSGDTKNG